MIKSRRTNDFEKMKFMGITRDGSIVMVDPENYTNYDIDINSDLDITVENDNWTIQKEE